MREHSIDDLPIGGVTVAGLHGCEPKPVTAYTDHAGRIWRNADDCARFGLGTHTACGRCERVAVPRSMRFCRACRSLRAIEKWEALPRIAWDGKEPVTLLDGDDFFWDTDELDLWLDGQDVEPPYGPEETPPLLINCIRQSWKLCDPADVYESVYCEDWDPSDDLPRAEFESLLRQANALLHKHPPRVWEPATGPDLRAVIVPEMFTPEGLAKWGPDDAP
jgi:hypothetical protein